MDMEKKNFNYLVGLPLLAVALAMHALNWHVYMWELQPNVLKDIISFFTQKSARIWHLKNFQYKMPTFQILIEAQ